VKFFEPFDWKGVISFFGGDLNLDSCSGIFLLFDKDCMSDSKMIHQRSALFICG